MTQRQLFIGIDPGAKGAICLLEPIEKLMAFCPTDLPIRKQVDWLNMTKEEGNVRFVCIEDVHSLHGMSAKSNFNFGRNLQLLHDAIDMAELPKDLVQPKKWQKNVGVKSGLKGKEIKLAVAELCTNLYPRSATEIYGPKGGLLDGRSDALMIAHHCYLTHKISE